MSLARYLRLHETGTRAARALGGIILAQTVLAAIALVASLLNLCGACGGGDKIHAAIAGSGVFAYMLLWVLLRVRAWTGVFTGVFAAAGVHVSLTLLMFARGRLCGVCTLAACLSLVGPAVLLFSDRQSALWLARATVPSFLLAGLATWMLFAARDSRAEARRVDARREAIAHNAKSGVVEAASAKEEIALHVFEAEGCPYCLEFKKSYAPRLKNDFPDLAIVYHPSAAAPWVRRSPTFVLGGEILFEGLPLEYGDLTQAVRDTHRAQESRRR